MNDAAFALEERAFGYASDTRGTHPFVPVVAGRPIACPQLPTTLPTLDELIGRDGMDADGAAEQLVQLTREPPATGHVYTLHAELEGMRLLPVFERLVSHWRMQGYALCSLRDAFAGIGATTLPRHAIVTSSVPGRSGTLACQGPSVAA